MTSLYISLPVALLAQLPNLSSVFNMEVWSSLSTEERAHLRQFLPKDRDNTAIQRIMEDLFLGANFNFGNPVEKLFSSIKGNIGYSCCNIYNYL